MRIIKRDVVAGAVALALTLALTGGCGGGGGLRSPLTNNGSSSRARGSVSLAIQWPERDSTRVVPRRAESIKITLTRTAPGATVQPVPARILTRPAAGQPLVTQTTFANLELGTYTVEVVAFPNADGTGTPLAQKITTSVLVNDGNNNPLAMTMDATVEQLVITSALGTKLAVGSPKSATRQLVVTAHAADTDPGDGLPGPVVPVDPAAIQWTSSNGSILTVNGNGLVTAVATGGPVTVTARYVEPGTPAGAQGTGDTATIVLNVVPPGLLQTNWPKFHGNAQNTGLATVGAATNGVRRWQFTTGGSVVFSSPAVAPDGSVYVGAYDNNLYAIDAAGELRWTVPTGGVIDSSPAISADGTVYFGSGDGNVYAVNGETGEIIWKVLTNGPVHSSPVIDARGVLYIGNEAPDGALYALDSLNGEQIWRFPTGDTIQTAPALSQDESTVYFGSRDGNLYAVNVVTGALRWRFDTNEDLFTSSPAIGADGTIYFGTLDGKLYALTPAGDLVAGGGWPVSVSGSIYSTPAIAADGTVYFGTFDNVSGNSENRLYAVNGTTGALNWTFPEQNGSALTDGITSSPAIGADGTVYAASYDGNVYGVNPDGTEKWRFNVGDNIDSSPAIGPDGAIYIGGYNSRVYAIE